MAHFYDCSNPKSLELKQEITTPSKAIKAGKRIYPSVTTIIGSTIKDPFLDSVWKPRNMVEFARMEDHWGKDWKQIEQLCYGERECPESGKMIPSSEFGTRVHNCAEKLLQANHQGVYYEEDEYYDPYAQPFIDWVNEKGHKLVATEYMISDNLIKTCGSIDAVLRHQDTNELFLADYKCRKRKQFYDKDLWQLAIESEMIRRKGKLKYLPQCVSICIDINTKKHHHKLWSEQQVKEAIQIFKWLSKLYWKLRMK